MARIEHRRPRAGGTQRARLPVVGRLFLVLAALGAGVELWPVVDAMLAGATEWWSGLPDLLAPAARSAALIAMPAAVAWASPAAPDSGGWLWKGAVIVAFVQLLRVPLGALQESLAQGGDETGFLASVAVSLLAALLSVLGVWALSEGVKDAGGRVGRPALALVAVGMIAVVIATFGPTVLAATEVDATLALGVASVVVNGLFLVAHGILAARTVAGAARRIRPARAWLAGAVATIALLAIPLISLGVTILRELMPIGETGGLLRVLTVLVFLGWPLFALAVAMGMARLSRWTRPLDATPRFEVQGPVRFAPPASTTAR